jgi:hypothetical protein
MSSWTDHLVPIALVLFFSWMAWSLVGSLKRKVASPAAFHLSAFCTRCGWHGRVASTRVACAGCGSNRVRVTTT